MQNQAEAFYVLYQQQLLPAALQYSYFMSKPLKRNSPMRFFLLLPVLLEAAA